MIEVCFGEDFENFVRYLRELSMNSGAAEEGFRVWRWGRMLWLTNVTPTAAVHQRYFN